VLKTVFNHVHNVQQLTQKYVQVVLLVMISHPAAFLLLHVMVDANSVLLDMLLLLIRLVFNVLELDADHVIQQP